MKCKRIDSDHYQIGNLMVEDTGLAWTVKENETSTNYLNAFRTKREAVAWATAKQYGSTND